MYTTLFFDLDGTLIDVRKRHIAVYHTVAEEMNLPIVSDDIYWERKRNRLFPWSDISEEICQQFRKKFKEASEKPDMLTMDSIYPGIVPLLERLVSTHTMVLVTKRYSPTNLDLQLKNLEIDLFFTTVLTPNPGSKSQAIQGYGFNDSDVVIGDTEEDITTAKELNLPSIAVTWGVRTNAYLLSYTPTFLTNTIEELQTYLTKEK